MAGNAPLKKDFHAPIQRGTGGPDTPSRKKHKHIRVFSNPGQDPLKNYKADGPAFNFGPMMVLLIHSVAIIEFPKWQTLFQLQILRYI